jgi:hypothetical protein
MGGTMVLQFTLDTCCVIDGAQEQCAWVEVNELVELAQRGVIELWLTTAFDADQRRGTDQEKLTANLRWLQDRPVIRRTMNPARLDYSESMLGFMVLAGEDDAATDRILHEIIPYKARDKKRALAPGMHPKIDDIHHLLSHRMQGNDLFVTRDGDMLDVHEELQRRVGIRVATPATALRRAHQENV